MMRSSAWAEGLTLRTRQQGASDNWGSAIVKVLELLDATAYGVLRLGGTQNHAS